MAATATVTTAAAAIAATRVTMTTAAAATPTRNADFTTEAHNKAATRGTREESTAPRDYSSSKHKSFFNDLFHLLTGSTLFDPRLLI